MHVPLSYRFLPPLSIRDCSSSAHSYCPFYDNTTVKVDGDQDPDAVFKDVSQAIDGALFIEGSY